MRDMIYCDDCNQWFSYKEGCYCEQRKCNQKFLYDNYIHFNDVLTLKNNINVIVLPDKREFFKCVKLDNHDYCYSVHNIKCNPQYKIIMINGILVGNIVI